MFKKKKFYVVQWKSLGYIRSETVLAKSVTKALKKLCKDHIVDKIISIKEVDLNEIMA